MKILRAVRIGGAIAHLYRVPRGIASAADDA